MNLPAKPRVLSLCACAALVAFVLPGCRESEQDRVLLYKKGTYMGKADQQLTSRQLDALRARTRNQSQ